MNIDIKTAYLEYILELYLKRRVPLGYLQMAFSVRNNLEQHENRLKDLFIEFNKEIPNSSKDRVLLLEYIMVLYFSEVLNFEDLQYSYKNFYKKSNELSFNAFTRH